MESTTPRGTGGSGTKVSVFLFAAVLLLGTVMLPATVVVPAAAGGATVGGAKGAATLVDSDLPDGHFTENLGQVRNEDVRLYLSAGSTHVGFAKGAVLLAVVEHSSQKPDAPPSVGLDEDVAPEDSAATRGVAVRISFANSHIVEPKGRGELSFTNNYFLGNNSSKWLTGVRNYREVVYKNLYDGIDLVYGVKEGHLKYEFHVSAGADPTQIEMAYEGVNRLRLDSDGGMTASTAVGDVSDFAPVAYQGEDEIKCPFSLRGLFSFGFACQGWDASRALVIDPLVYSTFLGGTGSDRSWDMTADASGTAYTVGSTTSPDFPVTLGAFDISFNGTYDGYIAKLNPDGSSLSWATFLGGSDWDWTIGVALDSFGDVYVCGSTKSTDFPATMGAYDTSYNDGQDAFVARLTGNGVLIWATYLGAAKWEMGHDIALDSSGNLVVVSSTNSSDFPVTPGAFDNSYNGLEDAYIAKLDPSGAILLWATFLGGSDMDRLGRVTLGQDDSIYVTGMTYSPDFPITLGAFDTTLNGSSDAFIAKLDPTGSALVWATYLGGTGYDQGVSVALDGSGDLYVIGDAESPDFPVTPGAFDETLGGFNDNFIAKLNSTGSDLVWATYLGGSGSDTVGHIALDVAGDICVAGYTYSADFPVTLGAFDTTFDGTVDGVLARLNRNGTGLLYATFIGGSGGDGISGMALDSSGYAYLAGDTNSADFPVTPGAFETTYNGGIDAFVMKIGPVGPPNTPPILAWTGETNYVSDGLDPETGTTFTDFTYRVSYFDADNNSPAQIYVRIEKPLGTPYSTFPMSFVAWKGIPNNYTTGATYSFSTKLPAGTDYWYYFRATDGWEWASGPPTIPVNAPDVVADNPPIAVAQASPTSAFIGDTVTFDATASTDDFGISAYLWDFGDTSNGTGPLTTHAYASHGTFLATLTVWDTAGQNDTDNVSVSIGNRQPVADAGPDQSVNKSDLVTLNGTGSSDPDGDTLTYLWNQTGGPPVILTGADTATPTLTPAITGTYTFVLTVEDGWGGSSDDAVNVTAVNRAPIADAGLDQTVPKKTLVTLDGTGSSDPDGDSLTYAWTQTGGPSVILTGTDTATPTFTPFGSGVYVFQLVVDDNDGGTSLDSVQVTAVNAQPSADAGPDQTVRKKTLVTLNGSLSFDPDGDILTFSWTQLSGPIVTLTDSDTAAPTFTPPRSGLYVFQMTVNDGDGGEASDSIDVTATNLAPVAIAGPDKTSQKKTLVTLDGSLSFDTDGDILTFLWTQVSGPSIMLAGSDTDRPTFTPQRSGVYTFQLTVADGDGGVSSDTVTITATNADPVADAGPDQTVSKKTLVTLDGGGSSDPDGDSLTYAWTQTGGITVALAGSGTATPSFTPPRSGTYVFQLTVDDGDGGTSQDTVTVTATNQPPTANAGVDRSAQKNGLATLDGSGSSDPNGDALTFAWTQVSGGSVTLTGAGTAAPTFTPTKTGTYVFSLRVDDGDGGTSDDTVTVTVWGLPPNADLVADPLTAKVGDMINLDASGSTDPDGTIVDYSFSFGDNASASGTETVRGHSYATAGSYTVTLIVTDDDGNTSTTEVTIEVKVLPPPPEVETNYKPLVALVLAVILAVVGIWSSRRRPWKGGKDRTAVLKTFIVFSLPLVLAEILTGVLSIWIEPLRIPPAIGLGTGADVLILIAGVLFLVLRTMERANRKKESRLRS